MSVNAMTFTAGQGSGGIRCEDLLSERPSKEAKAALKIKPITKKMVTKSKIDARSDGLLNSFQTTSMASGSRANKVGFKVRMPEEHPAFPNFSRRKVNIGTSRC